jgi:hypothetical protein
MTHDIIKITNENDKFEINYRLDFNKFVQNQQYQQAIIQGYNLVKV